MKKILLTTILGFGIAFGGFADNSGYYLGGTTDVQAFDNIFRKTRSNLIDFVESELTTMVLRDLSDIIAKYKVDYVDIMDGEISRINLGYFSNLSDSDRIIQRNQRLRDGFFKESVQKMWKNLNNMFYIEFIRISPSKTGMDIVIHQGFSGSVYIYFSKNKNGKLKCNEVMFLGETNKKYKL